MSLYPSLEDMKVDQMQQAQRQYEHAAAATANAIAYPQGQQPVQYPGNNPVQYPQAPTGSPGSSLYPSLTDYMGLDLSPETIAQTMPVVAAHPQANMQVATRQTATGHQMVAPITGQNMGLMRAEVKGGIREVVLCKDQEGKMGLRVRGVNKGLFVAFVHVNSASALAGLRFGDQILQINNETVAGWDTDKAMKYLKNCGPTKITMAIRDRPFERTITMQKDSTGHIGFVFHDCKIKSLVKDSSAARNGVLIEHHLIEVDGQNVVGLKDKEIGTIIESAGRTVTITLMPSFIYEHIVKCMGNSLVKKFMDHSIPDL